MSNSAVEIANLLYLYAEKGFPLQPVAAGRYHDKFERVGGTWRFNYRDYSLLDLIGNVTFHLMVPVTS